MNVWLVTTGSSDVQLKTDDPWNQWHQQVRKSYYRLPFEPKQAVDQADEPYRIAPRVLGIVNEAFPDQVWANLTFPLLDAFRSKLQEEAIDKILLLVTDQSEIFDEEHQDDLRCPYWQDTSALLSVFKLYLQEHFPDAEVIPLYLEPEANTTGLDNWNQVLEIVRSAINEVKLEPETLYVSHQAGTPAISSAVQFASLAKFGDRVKFLVSNEYNSELTDFVESSSYLRGIQVEQAKKLLARHDYAGATELIQGYLDDNTKILLNAAIQWNFAKFESFADEVEKLTRQRLQTLVEQIKDRRENWWWTAYEAAYLAFVRLDQKNGVEAFFHSFRAVEGLISKWAEVCFQDHIELNNDSPKLKASILEVRNLNYFGKSKYADHKARLEQDGYVVLSGFPLYTLLRAAKPNWKSDCKELTDFIEKIAPTRNKVFHRLRGLEIDDVFEAWLIDREKAITEKTSILKEKIVKYLNFVSEEAFKSLEEASLMAKVHRELEAAIANL